MFNLQRFGKEELVFDQQTAFRVLSWFFGESQLRENDITENDIAFAQALVVEAVDGSNAMGIVEGLMRSFLYRVPTSFSSIRNGVLSLVRRSSSIWWRNKNVKNLKDVVIYDSVRNTLVRNFRSEWESRVQTGEQVSTYLR